MYGLTVDVWLHAAVSVSSILSADSGDSIKLGDAVLEKPRDTLTGRMPRPRTACSVAETWQTCTPPQTPLQQCVFLDMCTKWLVQEPSLGNKTAERLETRTCWSDPATHTADESLMVRTHSELRTQRLQTCAFCKATTGVRPIVANPFAQRCFILLCEGCRAL